MFLLASKSHTPRLASPIIRYASRASWSGAVIIRASTNCLDVGRVGIRKAWFDGVTQGLDDRGAAQEVDALLKVRRRVGNFVNS